MATGTLHAVVKPGGARAEGQAPEAVRIVGTLLTHLASRLAVTPPATVATPVTASPGVHIAQAFSDAAYATAQDMYAANMARIDAEHQAFEEFMALTDRVTSKKECIVDMSRRLESQRLRQRAERSCALRHIIAKRLLSLKPPKWCSSAELRGYANRANRAILHGEFEQALGAATQAWLLAPTWKPIIVARGMLLRYSGREDEARATLATIQRFLAKREAWGSEAKFEQEQNYDECLESWALLLPDDEDDCE